MSADTGPLESGKFWLLTLAAGAALLLAALSILVAQSNQALRADIDSRQQFINQTIRVSRLNTQFIQALANVSARTGDEEIRKLLADHGISYSASVTAEPATEGDDETAGEPAEGQDD